MVWWVRGRLVGLCAVVVGPIGGGCPSWGRGIDGLKTVQSGWGGESGGLRVWKIAALRLE